MIQTNVKQRQRLNEGIFIPTAEGERFAQLEKAFAAFHDTKGIHKKVRAAARQRRSRRLTQLIFILKVWS